MIPCVYAQSTGKAPDIPVTFNLYAPASISVVMAGSNTADKNIKVTQQGTSWTDYGITSDPRSNSLTARWMTNDTDTWQIDIFVNYTTPVDQMISIAAYSPDSLGVSVGGRAPYHIVAIKVWIHLEVNTRLSPRFPTTEEEMQFIIQPGNPLINSIDRNTQAITGNSGLTQYVQLLIIAVVFNIVLTVILALILFRRGG